MEIIKQSKREVNLLIPYADQSAVSSIYNEYSVINCDYREDGVFVVAVLDNKGQGLYKKYIVS